MYTVSPYTKDPSDKADSGVVAGFKAEPDVSNLASDGIFFFTVVCCVAWCLNF